MSLLVGWLDEHVRGKSVPLLREEGGVVSTMMRGGRRTLERHPSFTELMASTVEGDCRRILGQVWFTSCTGSGVIKSAPCTSGKRSAGG
jgi:hypothetical protein